ncbi:hypothetical protein NNC19_03870 [Clostridium sp. SHJSY1]|uniref:hypothetical protein n=1 Tax=Clostridium sp. SHJSY1 TaxID=2942483 RepID=UPI0028767AE4|nr:hypothetical protein [Clostridium sp. SHJSY1]MDS0524805.1 hypothetical protein [Clostridium sp. SHJSY1]
MSLRSRDRRKKSSSKDRIELTAVLNFVKFLQCIACGILGISLLGLLAVGDNISARVIYTMVIVVNLMIILLGKIPVKYLMKKSNILNQL